MRKAAADQSPKDQSLWARSHQKCGDNWRAVSEAATGPTSSHRIFKEVVNVESNLITVCELCHFGGAVLTPAEEYHS